MKALLLIVSISIYVLSCANKEPKPAHKDTSKPEETQLEATVDKMTLELGEVLRLDLKWTLSVKVDERPSTPSKAPEFSDFELLSESSSVSKGFFINDFLHWTYTYSYELSPKRAGELLIGGAELTINGENFKTNPIVVVVSTDKYQEFIKTNKCEKEYWSRYELGEYFRITASNNKLSPYDLVYGDSYITRNVGMSVLTVARGKFLNYLRDMPELIRKKFDQRFGGGKVNSEVPTSRNYENQTKKSENQKMIFNASVKSDSECYRKLK